MMDRHPVLMAVAVVVIALVAAVIGNLPALWAGAALAWCIVGGTAVALAAMAVVSWGRR